MNATSRWTITAIKAENKKKGQHFFKAGTIRFFDSRIETKAINGPGGVFFVTSEQFHGGPLGNGPRLFTVRQFKPETGRIATVGFFQPYKTLEDAKSAAVNLAWTA